MKLSRAFNTIKYLTAKQIFYQVYYRLKKAQPLNAYKALPRTVNTHQLHFSNFLPVERSADSSGAFTFLNQQVTFGTNVDWNYAANGRLWNYNLQYVNYLLQDDIPLNRRLTLLKEIHSWLADGRLLLEPYPVSLRVINILHLLCKENLDDQNIIGSLYSELDFLSERLEYHLLGNHLLENGFALLMGGAFFGKEEWLDKGHKIVHDELSEQILADGGHFELSPMYHQIILYRVLELIDWYSHYHGQRDQLLPFIVNHASLMLEWLKNITFNNNEVPAFNDCAPGIAYTTEQLSQYAQALKIPVPKLRIHLSASGYRMFRRGDYECAVDVAAIGPDYQPGHSHADALSFILYYKNLPLFVEAGTSTYTQGKVRDYERSTIAHNTVAVDLHNSSDVWGGFRVADRAITTILKDTADELIAQHNGYKKKLRLVHKRSYKFETSKLLIKDELVGTTQRQGAAYFHLAPGIKYVLTGKKLSIPGIGNLLFTGAETVKTDSYFRAEGYNITSEATVIVVYFKKELQTVIEFYN